jgi:hypothetical protein
MLVAPGHLVAMMPSVDDISLGLVSAQPILAPTAAAAGHDVIGVPALPPPDHLYLLQSSLRN